MRLKIWFSQFIWALSVESANLEDCPFQVFLMIEISIISDFFQILTFNLMPRNQN